VAAPDDRRGKLPILGLGKRIKPPSQTAKACLATALLVCFGGIIAPSTISVGAIVTTLPFIAILALAAMGQHVVIQLGGFDLSVAGTMSFAAVIVTAFPQLDAGVGETAIYVALALFMGVVVGAANGIVVTKLRVPALVTTIGVNSLLLGATLFVSGGVAQQAPPPLSKFGVDYFLGVPVTFYVMLIGAGVAAFLISRTIIGRRFVAISVSPAAAAAVGIRLDTYRVAIYMLAGFCYATAGILLAGYLMSPTIFCGLPYLLASVAAVVVGGNPIGGGQRGSLVATVIGAIFLTYLGQLVLSVGLDTSAQFIVQAMIVVGSVAVPETIRRLRLLYREPTTGHATPPTVKPEASFGDPTSTAQTIPPIMELRGLRKSFGAVRALRGVDLEIRPGEVHAIVGENGAGKSTLISIAAGVIAADAGVIRYRGNVVAAPNPRNLRESGISVTYQHPTLAPDLTVLENLQLAAPDALASNGPAAAQWLLRRVATERLLMPLDRRIGELSLAQRHIVEIARALISEPKVVFFDEPTEPFQQPEIEKLFALIKALSRDGAGVIYVSHRLQEVMELADRISVMRDGEIIDCRPTTAFTMSEIISLIAGRPLGQMFPPKSEATGVPALSTTEFSGSGFSNVNLTVRGGEIVGLAGVEGEGQREFLRAASGIHPHAGGTLRVSDRPLRHEGVATFRRAGIGFVSEDRHAEGVFLGLTVRENVGIGILDRISPLGIVNRAAEIAAAADVMRRLQVRAASLDALLKELSGGNQQKVLIGREMAANPAVLLVDEPTKGVDIGARTEIYQRLRALADAGATVVISSSDGLELEGLCNRVLIFARGRVVKELVGNEVTDASITEANLTATVSRDAATRSQQHDGRWRRILSNDHLPAAILAALTGVILAGTNILNPYFLSAFSIAGMLVFLALLTFLSIGQLLTMLVGAVDLSVGPLAGLVVVLASFLAPDSTSTGMVLGGAVAILAFCTAFGFAQGWLVTRMGLPAIVVTLASFIGLQGVSLVLRPTAAGNISDTLSDAVRFPILGLPAGILLTFVIVAGLEWLLYRSGIGRRLRAVGSSAEAAKRLGIDTGRHQLLAFILSGIMTGIGGLVLAGQVGIGSALTGVDFTIMSITAVVLGGASVAGGRGSAICTLFGAALVQATSSASSFINSDSAVHYTVLGIVTLLAAIFFCVGRRDRARIA
jgi:ribose transport system ATP-binding protein